MPWARLKPYNRDAGCLKQRFVVGGRCFHGGDGSPGSVPVWYRVSKSQAEYLRQFRQRDDDPFSRHAFDIVASDEEKDAITHEESIQRMMALGVVANPQLARARPREETLSAARPKRVKLSDMADDADVGDAAADQRMAALQGLSAPAASNEEPPRPMTSEPSSHEELNSDDDDDGFSSDEFTSPEALHSANAEARARIPDMTAVEPDGAEPPPKSKTKLEADVDVAVHVVHEPEPEFRIVENPGMAAKATKPIATGLPAFTPGMMPKPPKRGKKR